MSGRTLEIGKAHAVREESPCLFGSQFAAGKHPIKRADLIGNEQRHCSKWEFVKKVGRFAPSYRDRSQRLRDAKRRESVAL